MYNFDDNGSQKHYGRVVRGWHKARAHSAELRTSRSRKGERQYIKVDFELLEKRYSDILVPGFFNHYPSGKADRTFLDLGRASGLKGDYGENVNQVLKDLVGRDVEVFVVHRYKDGRRLEKAVEFRPFPQPDRHGAQERSIRHQEVREPKSI